MHERRDISTEDYNTLRNETEKAVKSLPSYYLKPRSEDEYKDIITEVIVSFYERLLNNSEKINNPYDYLLTTARNIINHIDENLFNKEYLYFKQVCGREVAGLIEEGSLHIIRDDYISDDPEKTLNTSSDGEYSRLSAYALSFPLEHLSRFERYTEPVKDELKKMIVFIVRKCNTPVNRQTLMDAAADRIGVTTYQSVPAASESASFVRESGKEEKLSQHDFTLIDEIIEKYINIIKNNYIRIRKFSNEYIALWYYRVHSDYTLQQTADKLGYKSPNNIDYYLRKFDIENLYNSFIRDVCLHISEFNKFEAAISYSVHHFDMKLEGLFNRYAGEHYEK